MRIADNALLAGLVAGGMLVVGLWQLEMMWIHKSWGFTNMSLPFGATAKWWFIRDVWYLLIVTAFVIVAGLKLRKKRD